MTLRAKKYKHIKQFCMTSFSLHNVSKSLVNLLCSVLRNFTWIPKAQTFLIGLLMAMSQFSCSEKYVNFTGPETEELFIRILLECFSIVIFCLLLVTNLGCGKFGLPSIQVGLTAYFVGCECVYRP